MLTPSEIDQYHRGGFVLARGIFNQAELDAMESAMDEIFDRRLKQRANLDATWSGDWKKDAPPDGGSAHA